MCKQHSIREPLDMVQYKWFLIPKFKDGMGVCVLKGHHSFADGLGTAQFLVGLSSKFDSKVLPGMKAIPVYKKVIIWILSPYLILKACFQILFLFRRVNSINTDQPMTG